MLRLLSFSVSEALVSIRRSRVLNLLAIGTIMFAMFILGSFLFLGFNLNKLTIDWKKQLQFNVFLQDDIPVAQKDAVAGYLENSTVVERVAFLDREQAYERFNSNFSTYTDVAEALEENPFPASFQVVLVEGVGKGAFEKLKNDLKTFQGIEEVYYDEEVYQRLDFVAGLVRFAGIFFGFIMVFSAIFTISNVLKLTFFTRRDEVDIMKLVGASRGYIRGPFIIEGVLHGLTGAGLGIGLVFFGFLGLDSYLAASKSWLGTIDLVFFPLSWAAGLVLAGGLSGLLGSLFSLNQFLEEHISYQ